MAFNSANDAQPNKSAMRWGQLLIAILCMSMIANLQYGWTLFVNPIHDKYHWSKASIQVAFTIFVLAETWLVPLEGYLVDRLGPRPVVLASGLLVGLSWAIDAQAHSLIMLYVAAALGGIGAGGVYGTCVGNALKWFPDRRGLAAGLTAMGFGAGSALTIVPIAAMIKASGYQATFLYFGIGQGVALLALACFLIKPPLDKIAGWGPFPTPYPNRAVGRDYTPLQMLSTPTFWVMYAMFVMMASGGLMATAQLAPIAEDFHVAKVPVSLLGFTLPALTFALSLDRILNGVTRPFFGWVSDRIGREMTMFVAFGLEGLGIILLSQLGRDPVAFVVLTGVVFFAWGEIYSLFPATCGDSFGVKFATTNAGLLYTAKGTAALLVPISSLLAASGGWTMVFWAAALLNLASAAMALLVLKPLRTRLRLGLARTELSVVAGVAAPSAETT
jgi:OFA family oxalate/formate antiporter-like MFS transporter